METPAQVTEAHNALWIKLYNLAHDEIFDVASSDGPATQLIADSEARATGDMRRHAEMIDQANRELLSQCDQLRLEFADFKKRTWEHDEYNARVMSERSIERDQLRAAVQFVIDHAGKEMETELGIIRCSELWMAEQLGFALDAP